ncbi:efflux RND transporter permease subunit [Desulfosporosinus sp. SB140]|uniref:efflux RND transporter permease subunit n=1 Tax=Desulfosporosinus paludis TaxID=3115649 RepID=UPI00388DB657
MKIANLSVDRPVLISMLIVVLILLGAITLPLLPVDLYPNMDIPIAIVSVSWPGYSPSVVEQQLTKPLESAMSTVSDVSEVDSTSRSGQSTVMLHFNYGANLDQAIANMRDKLNQVAKGLPTDAGVPSLMKVDPNSQPIISLALSGKNVDVEQLNQLANDVVSPDVQQVNGVSAVNVNGGKARQIQVIVDPNKLYTYNLATTSIISALQNDNMQSDAGVVNKGNQTIDLHVNGQFITPGDVLNVPVHLPSGGTIKISDVAQVKDAYADITSQAFLNGVPCVSLDVMKVSGGNTVQVSSDLQKILPAINKALPKGIKLSVVSDQAVFIKQSINTVIDHTLMGGGFALIILWLFLRKIRTTVVIGIVIPIAVVSTFAALYFAHQTINTITLGGLSVGLGSLVDFAVVVIESIFRFRESGYGPSEAAKLGTSEVGTAVMASALAQISVFTPIIFIQGLASQMFMPMALAVIFSHIAALFGALTLVPMLSAKLMGGKGFGENEDKGSRWNPAYVFSAGIHKLTLGYGKLLRWALNHRKTVLIATVLLLASSIAIYPLIGFELTPSLDQGMYSVRISLTQGTNLDTTNKITSQVENAIMKMPETDSMYTTVGSGGGTFSSGATNTASIKVNLKPSAQRKRSVFTVIEDLRKQVANIPGAQITLQATQQTIGRSSGSGVDIDISGNDLNVLSKLGDLVVNQVSQVSGTRNVTNGASKTSPEYDLNIDRQKAGYYGITIAQILSTLRADYGGTKATSYIAGSTAVDVVVQMSEDYTRDFSHLNDIMLLGSGNQQVPLTAVATVKPGVGPASISRTNQMNQITVSGDIYGRSVGEVQNDIKAQLDQISFPSGYSWSFGGSSLDMASSFKSLGMAMPLSIILMFMVMAGQFESLFSPFIIMFSLPPTFVGVMLGLLVMRQTLSMNSLIGIIMLIGIVVNNAIVLVDYTNQLRQKGLSVKEALCQAGPIRLRPILMTTCTTVMAMLPVMLGHGDGSEAQAPMATVVVFGLTISTLVTLVLVPVMYTIIHDFRERFHRFLHKKTNSEVEVNPTVTG